MNKLSILINSCDNYSDTWDPFFFLFNKFWNDNKYPIFLNTESKQYRNSNLDINIINQLEPNKKIEWSQRLIDTLNRIDSEYVLMILDDFFLLDFVDTKRLEQCLEWMDKDTNIANFCFNDLVQPNILDNKYEGFERRPDECEYKLNCQAGIWRKEKLLSYLRGHENPWEFETLGSKRASKYHDSFYSAIVNSSKIMVYDYQNCGLVRGKWAIKTPEYLKDLYQIDYSIRGFFNPNQEIHVEKNIFKRAANYIKYLINKKNKEIRSK